MLGLIIGAAVWGGTTVILLGLAIFYGSLVKEAEKRRDIAEEIAQEAVRKQQSIEEDFTKLKNFFEQTMNRPVQAMVTDEQIDNIRKYLASAILPFTSTLGKPS